MLLLGAAMAKKILAWSNSASQFYREIGKLENGRPFRFYLGDDDSKAANHIPRLVALWRGVKERWQDFKGDEPETTPFPCWDELTLTLGRAIARGEWSVRIEPPDEGPEDLAVWHQQFKTYFPMIQVEIEIVHKDKLEEGKQSFIDGGKEMADKEQTRHKRKMRIARSVGESCGGKMATRETLHDALEAYKVWIEKKFVDIDGRTTQTGKKQGERAERLKRLTNDIPLSEFGIPEIEAIIEFWRTRPKKTPRKSKPVEPYSFSLCKHTIRLFKHFLRWLHKEPTFPWKKPVELEFDRLDIVKDREIKYKIEVYTKEELGILWQHASHFERQLLLLALNCAFSISEIGSLTWTEIEGEYIKGLRPKTKVYGEFWLWEITRKALGESKKKGLVLTTEAGLSLIAPTEGNNTSKKIPNAWNRLLRRIKKHEDHKDFRMLGFHHLRKTAGDLIRKLSDGETMAVFLRHGKPVKSDPLADRYSNPAFP
jgi:integrase